MGTRAGACARRVAVGMLVVALLGLGRGPLTRAGAASRTFVVTSAADTHDAQPGDGQCADAAGQCTLRSATEEANAAPVGSVTAVTLPTGVYTLTLGALTLLTNTLTISTTTSVHRVC